MRKERRLARLASDTAERLGHTITAFQFDRSGTKITGRSKCRHCGMEVMIDTNPLVNETEMGGEAIELRCC